VGGWGHMSTIFILALRVAVTPFVKVYWGVLGTKGDESIHSSLQLDVASARPAIISVPFLVKLPPFFVTLVPNTTRNSKEMDLMNWKPSKILNLVTSSVTVYP
jgi:hypothetical protein